jgi:hypothetical protein
MTVAAANPVTRTIHERFLCISLSPLGARVPHAAVASLPPDPPDHRTDRTVETHVLASHRKQVLRHVARFDSEKYRSSPPDFVNTSDVSHPKAL